jgi:3-oxoacyl-[acyl-carrier protein] reductase
LPVKLGLDRPFETDRLLETARQWAHDHGLDEDEVLARRRAANPAGRFGLPHEFGDACAFLCSAQAGFITGQSLLLDSGSYPGTF